MTQRQTEMRHPAAEGLDLLAPEQILQHLVEGQIAAARAVESAIPAIAAASALAARTIREGGRLVYVAAGSSGLMALADALELPGTYGITMDRVAILFAGGAAALRDMQGGPEDDAEAARRETEALTLCPEDCVIAVTASGRTPYPLAAVEVARAAGARRIGIANNVGARIFDMVDVGICLPTPPEVIAGSTRMGAGTAQKIALNMFSTLMATELGHVHDGMMVNVIADNEKLRERARDIVATAAGVDAETASRALGQSNGSVKTAILVASGASVSEAGALLETHGGMLRPALQALKG